MTNHTSVYRPDPMRINHVVVSVRGNLGGGTFVRRSWEEAIHTARRYARLFDAPATTI